MPRNAYDNLVTLNKRKRGIVRKAIELSQICEQELYIAIYDKEKDQLVQYKSSAFLSPEKLTVLQNASQSHEKYDNGDYEMLSGKFVTKEKLLAIQERKKTFWANAEVPQEEPTEPEP